MDRAPRRSAAGCAGSRPASRTRGCEAGVLALRPEDGLWSGVAGIRPGRAQDGEFCPLCGFSYVSLCGSEHLGSGCFLGILVGSIVDREELSFGDAELHRLAESGYGLEWLWEGFGVAATDALEDLLVECGAERREI